VRENPSIARIKIRHRTHRDGQQICHQHIHPESPHKQAHQQQGAHNRNCPVAKVKAQQSGRTAAPANFRAILPRQSLMPHKILEHRRLDRYRGCRQIRAARSDECFKNCQLDSNSDCANEKKFSYALNSPSPQERRHMTHQDSSTHRIFSSR
jgi:hypothetical protein